MNDNPTGPLDRDGRVQTDLACLKCGYNLRTLPADGFCPECALAVARSVRGDLLKCAEPEWVRKLAGGATMLLVAAIAALILLPATLLAELWLGAPPQELLQAVRDGLLLVGTLGSGATATLAGLAGILAITAPEPRSRLKPEGLSARRVCRYSLLATMIMLGVTLVAASFADGWAWWVSQVYVLAGLILGLGVLPLSFLRHLTNLLRRVPVQDHADTARGIAVGICVANALLVVPMVLRLFARQVPGSPPSNLACPAVFVGFLCYVTGLHLLNGARKRFREAADEAAAGAA